jgi:membrane-bound lytic murein transglycosylase D
MLTLPTMTSRRSALCAVLLMLGACRAEPDVNATPVAQPNSSESPGTATAAPTTELAGNALDTRPSVTLTDLDKRTADLFGSALKLDAAIRVPADSGVTGPDDIAPAWDIDVRSYETLDRVQFYVNHFSGPAKGRFTERLALGSRYESMIREKLLAADLPADMYFLALVESGYNPHAYSRAAAVGMWQFMTTTAKGMGLRVDWWVDERRDPVRSTDAAVRFLRGLNEQFGSMYLAAAAYNGGPGRVARGLTRYEDDLEGTTGDDLFFALAEKKYLRTETRNYVPQLIAAALVAKEAPRYGISFATRESFAYDSVRVGPRVPLALIARAAGTTVDVIQDLNSHILRGMTPPSDSFKVRIPPGTVARFDSAFATIPADSIAGAKTVRTKKGATWSSLAREHRVSARAIPLYNPKVKPAKKTGQISAGTSVLIPTPTVVAAALNVPDPAIERYGVGTSRHIVRQGENLSVIAKRYRTTPAAIMRLNRLKKPLIFPGQELLVSGRASAKPASNKQKATTKR